MIMGLGTDIVAIERINNVNQNNRLAERILSNEEKEAYNNLSNEHRQREYLAGRFAAKEAYAKALGTGIGKRIGFKDIIVLNHPTGAPYIHNDSRALISISHTETHAMATVLIQD